MLYFLKPCGVLYRGLQRLSACVPYLEGESIVSDEKKEKNLTEHTQENQPVQHSDADIEQILNEVRQKQNYEPKTQHADVSQEDAGQASEQKKEPLEQVQNVPAQESASLIHCQTTGCIDNYKVVTFGFGFLDGILGNGYRIFAVDCRIAI